MSFWNLTYRQPCHTHFLILSPYLLLFFVLFLWHCKSLLAIQKLIRTKKFIIIETTDCRAALCGFHGDVGVVCQSLSRSDTRGTSGRLLLSVWGRYWGCSVL